MQPIKNKLIEIEQFLKSKGFTPKTVKTYISVLGKIFYNIGLDFKEFELENFLARWKGSPKSYNQRRAIANFYTQQYLGYSLTFTKSKIPKKLPIYATEKEFYLLLKHTLNFKHKIGLSLMFRSGLRVSEVCSIRKNDIDINSQIITLRQGKGNKDRRTVIPNKFAYYLNLYLKTIKDYDYLFRTYRGHISERSFEEVIKSSRKKAGITKKITCHSLRHGFAVNAINKKIPVEELRKMLGHEKLTTTQIYLQCLNQDLTVIARSI